MGHERVHTCEECGEYYATMGHKPTCGRMKTMAKSELDDIEEFATLIERARALGPMTDEQRREQAASFAFGNLALTGQWQDKDARQLAELRDHCRKAAGCHTRPVLPLSSTVRLDVPTLMAVVESVSSMEHFGEGLIHQGDLLATLHCAIKTYQSTIAYQKLDEPRRAAVSLVEYEGKVLCVWNRRYGGWMLPGGMVEEGEGTQTAQARELKEETSLMSIDTVLVFQREHGMKAKEQAREDRASHVYVFHVLSAKGTPYEKEAGCPVTWFTRDDFLKWSPFRIFYKEVFAMVPPVNTVITRADGDKR